MKSFTSKTESPVITMKEQVEDLIRDRHGSVRAFLIGAHYSPSYLRTRKGELGFNPYVLNFIDIANRLKIRPCEICLLYEGKIRSIPLRNDYEILDYDWADLKSTASEYSEILIRRHSLHLSELDARIYLLMNRLARPGYLHKVRLTSLYDAVTGLGGTLSEFFMLLEGEHLDMAL